MQLAERHDARVVDAGPLDLAGAQIARSAGQ